LSDGSARVPTLHMATEADLGQHLRACCCGGRVAK